MQIDEFESQFTRSSREPFLLEDVNLDRVLLVTDATGETATALSDSTKALFRGTNINFNDSKNWQLLSGNQFNSVREFLEIIEERKPDLIVIERHLKTPPDDRMLSLSSYIGAITHAAIPTILLPDSDELELSKFVREPREIMVNTNKLVGNNKLINWALKFSTRDCKIFLTHIEDDRAFDHYIDAISRIPEIDTNLAKETLRTTLLKMPEDFANQVKKVIGENLSHRMVYKIVKFGHSVRDHLSLIKEYEIDLLVLNTEDHHVRTLSDIAYGLTVECRDIPILLLASRE